MIWVGIETFELENATGVGAYTKTRDKSTEERGERQGEREGDTGSERGRRKDRLMRTKLIVRQPNHKISDIVFSLLIIYHWDVYNDIWGGVDLSPSSNFKHSIWRPRWFPPCLIFVNVQYFNIFCQKSMLF